MDKAENHLFILRGWQEGSEWRWSLLSSGDRRRLGFADLDGVYLYLSSLTMAEEEEDKKPGSDGSQE